MSILDNTKIMKTNGCDKALELVLAQLNSVAELELSDSTDGSIIENIVVACSGIEAVAAEIICAWLDFSIPLEIVRRHDLPNYVSDKTLVIICDVAGNRSESRNILEQASKVRAKVELITSTEQLADELKLQSAQVHILSTDVRLELATFGLVEVLLRVFASYGLASKRYHEELKRAPEQIEPELLSWQASVASTDNLAKQLADSILGKTPIIYAGPIASPLVFKWKFSLNQLAKNLAWAGISPGIDMVEQASWISQPIEKPFLPIFLMSSFERSEVLDNFEQAERSLSGRWPQPRLVYLSGKSVIAQLMWGSVLADATSVYLAALSKVKPF